GDRGRGASLEILAREAPGRAGADEREVPNSTQAQRESTLLRPTERAQTEEEPGQARRLLRDRAQAVLVERLERQRPGCDLRGMHEAVRVEYVPDVAEQAGDEARTEDQEDGDPGRDRAEEGRGEQG